MGRKPTGIKARFWAKVDKTKSCWIFTSNHGGTTYGMLSVPKGEEYLAHRISWVIHYGLIPRGLKVLHTCDQPRCVNPLHLFLGTSQDNMDDMVNKGRSLKGSRHPMTNMSESDVVEIRRLYQETKLSQQAIADMYRINQTAVGFIIRRITWKHI